MNEIERFEVLKEKTSKASESVIRIEERYKNEKIKLEALLKSITEKGYDPTKLAEIRNTKTIELNQILENLEKEIDDITNKISTIEVNTNA